MSTRTGRSAITGSGSMPRGGPRCDSVSRVSAEAATTAVPSYARSADDVLAALGADASAGLTSAEAGSRFTRYGANEIPKEAPPSLLAIALQQLREPMNVMLVAVTIVSFVIGEVSTAVLVALLILLNLVLGTRQELKARE